MVGSVAKWLRHLTGNQETQVQILAEPQFQSLISFVAMISAPKLTIMCISLSEITSELPSKRV